MNDFVDLLPDASEAGEVRRWFLPTNAEDDPGHLDPLPFYGRFLGMGTSNTARHTDHDGRFVRRGTRCNACRWYEARIFREVLLPEGIAELADLDDPTDAKLGEYLIHSAGMSIVPGEVPLFRYETTRSPASVIERMTTRRTTDGQPVAFLAKPSAYALAEAVLYDRALHDAYDNRAVS
jgi:hypothetical protein